MKALFLVAIIANFISIVSNLSITASRWWRNGTSLKRKATEER